MDPRTEDIRDEAAAPETDTVNNEELAAPRDPGAEADDSDDGIDGIDEEADEEPKDRPDAAS